MTRTTTTKTPTSKTPKTVSALDVLAALLAGPEQDRTMQTLLPLAEAELPALVAAQFDLAIVSQASARMAAAAHTEAAKITNGYLQDIEDDEHDDDGEIHDSVSTMFWANAEAGFALGVLVGQRIGGVR